jgi:Monooxygenase af470-like
VSASEHGYDDAYVAHLWEQPDLCLALFGVQFHTPEGQRRYEESGIHDEISPSLDAARDAGPLLLNRQLMTEEGPVLMQYWRSYDDLDRWARRLPHMRWWRWLLENAGTDLSFYHEIYQVKTAEAIYEKGCRPVGPARFTTTSTVSPGEGRSKDRQARFAAANTGG